MSQKENDYRITQCVNCGDPYQEAKDRLKDFQMEASEEIYCENCTQQKHFGVIHSE